MLPLIRLFVVAGLRVGAATATQAQPCMTEDLFLSSPFPCMVSDKTFGSSPVQLTQSAAGDVTVPSIMVMPVPHSPGPPLNPGLQFIGPWVAGPGGVIVFMMEDLDVTAGPGFLIDDVEGSITGQNNHGWIHRRHKLLSAILMHLLLHILPQFQHDRLPSGLNFADGL